MANLGAKFTYRSQADACVFSRELSRRVDEYFAQIHASRHANVEMILKTVLGLALWIASYYWLMVGGVTPLSVIWLYATHGFAQLFMAFNIAHDANHGAYSSSKRINRLLGCAFDVVGVSSYVWRLMHNDSHHSFVNIRGADTTLISGNIFRFSPRDRRRPLHRYQHLYAPVLYSLSTLDWVMAKDYRWLRWRAFGNRIIIKHPLGELLVLFAGKIFYYGYTLVAPLLLLPVRWYTVLLGFTVMHLFLGFTISLIFQPNHFNEGSTFPEAGDNGRIANDYIKHIFDTTADYARGNPVAIWLLGGLNLHVIHHMFPQICHVHYRRLTELVRATARDHGLVYRERKSIAAAFSAHLKWLKQLGNTDETPYLDTSSPLPFPRLEGRAVAQEQQ